MYLACLSGSLALAMGCRDPAPATSAPERLRRGGAVQLAIESSIATLDPSRAWDEVSFSVIANVCETLVGYGPADDQGPPQIVPQLAVTWESSADARGFTFTLRPDLRLSDGAPLTAQTVVATFARLLRDPESPFGPTYAGLVGAEAYRAGTTDTLAGVVALDDRSVRFTLTAPDVSFPFLLAMKAAAPRGPADPDPRVGPVCHGPFVVARWRPGDELTLARNPHYRDPELPHVSRIVIRENLPRATALLAFERGELDLFERPGGPELALLRAHGWGPYVMLGGALSTIGARLDTTRGPLRDPRVRRALNLALDRAQLARLIGARGEPASGMIPPGIVGVSPEPPLALDRTAARRLLAEAGWPAGFSLEYAALDAEDHVAIAEFVAHQLATIGVSVRIRVRSFPALLALGEAPEAAPAMAFEGWAADYPDAASFLEPKFHSRARSTMTNTSGFSHGDVDRALDLAHTEVDVATRHRLLAQAAHDVAVASPWLWLFHARYLDVRQPWITGYRPHPIWGRELSRLQVAR